MDLLLNAEHLDFCKAMRSYLEVHGTSAKVRSAIESEAGYDPEAWRRLNEEIGVSAIGVPEKAGGAGGGTVARSVVAQELGRVLFPSPYLASAVLATDILVALGDPVGLQLAAELATGSRVGTIATDELAADGAIRVATDTVATADGDGWLIDGRKTHVLWASAADVLLVFAAAPDGPGWFVVPVASPSVTVEPLVSYDLTRRLSRVEMGGAPATRLAGDAEVALATGRQLGQVVIAAEQLGGMERVVGAAIDYAKLRVQFGRQIGSYQAVKHSIADMHIALEQARSVVRYAAWVADADPESLPAAACLAHAFVGPAYFAAATGSLRVFGGNGYTWEHDAHLYYKHAESSQLLLTSPDASRASLADLLKI